MIAALLRHGEYRQLENAPSAWQPFALTERGEQQAREAAAGLLRALEPQGWELDRRIESSRLLRAWQTAQIIADELQRLGLGTFTVSSHDALAERGLGAAANLTIPQIEAVLREDPRFDTPPPGWKADSHYRLPLQGAESLLQAGQRVAGHLEASLSDLSAPADRVRLFVGHGAAFRHAAFHLGVLGFEAIARLSMYHARPVFIERQAAGRWRQVAGDWKPRLIDEPFSD